MQKKRLLSSQVAVDVECRCFFQYFYCEDREFKTRATLVLPESQEVFFEATCSRIIGHFGDEDTGYHQTILHCS